LPEPDINRVYHLLLTQKVDVISGGLVCVSKLMGSMVMEHAVRNGIEGTVLRVTVAAQSEVFFATRDPHELEKKKNEVAGELIEKAVSAVANIDQKGSVEQRMLRTILRGSLQLTKLSKTAGGKDLMLVGL
jgi:hypothetical protein